jgi:hypothetical protein
MKKIAFVISMIAIVLAFTVNSASAQKATDNQKATTEKVTKASDTKTTTTAPAECPHHKEAKAGCAKEGEKANCSKTCSKAKSGCCKKGEAKKEEAPVPKK